MKGKVIFLCGPSASGKTYCAEWLTEKWGDRYQLIYGLTTRPPRKGDKPGFQHVTREEYSELNASGDLYGQVEVAGHLYATSLSQVMQAVQEGKTAISILTPWAADDSIDRFYRLGVPMEIIYLGTTFPHWLKHICTRANPILSPIKFVKRILFDLKVIRYCKKYNKYVHFIKHYPFLNAKVWRLHKIATKEY